MTEIRNFGGNVQFSPSKFYQPNSERELLDILRQHATGTIRVVASRHAWSNAIVTDDALVDMRNFREIEVREENGSYMATVGAGCQVKHLLAYLRQRGLTLPSVGLIAEQTIAGATATGTHGSGKHSLSHYLTSVRIACYPGEDRQPQIVELREGDPLRAARCSLGCLGVVVSVRLPCIPQYMVRESARHCETVEEALASESDQPIQQFFLLPHRWKYSVQQREVTDSPRSWSASLYRAYWFLVIDLGMHLAIKTTTCLLRSRTLTRLFFRQILPLAIFPWWKVVDQSDRMLTMKHELFRHLELESFVPKEEIVDAARFVETVLKWCDGADITPLESFRERLSEHQLEAEFNAIGGTFSHHYPVCFRRILRDDTLISMASGQAEWWYSISFITYVEPRDDFYRMATFLARSMRVLFGARIHWGKWFPLTATEIESSYANLDRFREICRDHDPHGVFQNEFTSDKLSFSDDG